MHKFLLALICSIIPYAINAEAQTYGGSGGNYSTGSYGTYTSSNQATGNYGYDSARNSDAIARKAPEWQMNRDVQYGRISRYVYGNSDLYGGLGPYSMNSALKSGGSRQERTIRPYYDDYMFMYAPKYGYREIR